MKMLKKIGLNLLINLNIEKNPEKSGFFYLFKILILMIVLVNDLSFAKPYAYIKENTLKKIK